MAAARNNRRRRRNRGRFGLLFKLLCLVALLVALTVGVTVFFQVEQVEVVGNGRYTQEEVVAASGIQIGDNLYRMNKYQIASGIRQRLPYVEELSIRRRLPSTIVITVKEWDAVAQILPPAAGAAGLEDGTETATQPWLISVGGKLLEPAPADSAALEVSGLTNLVPRAGTPLAVPQAEQTRLEALLALLSALEGLGLTGNVSLVELNATWLTLRYLERFDVKMPLNEDFSYHLRVLEEVVARTNERHGELATGSMDMTQADYDVVYAPD